MTDGPGKIEELFSDIHSWAEAKGTHLVVDKSAPTRPYCKAYGN